MKAFRHQPPTRKKEYLVKTMMMYRLSVFQVLLLVWLRRDDIRGGPTSGEEVHSGSDGLKGLVTALRGRAEHSLLEMDSTKPRWPRG